MAIYSPSLKYFAHSTTAFAQLCSVSRVVQRSSSAPCCVRRMILQAAAGVIFFNDVGYLGMCGHGSIGVITTLAHLGRVTAGTHRIETPVGMIAASLHADGAVSITNVPSYRYRSGVEINVPEWGLMHGDIAWGGNWFFLVADHHLDVAHS